MTIDRIRIRDARLPEELPHLQEFIMGTQRFEHAFEPNRRLDATVAAEYFKVLAGQVQASGGRILVAEGEDNALLGWGVVHRDEDDVYVIGEERTCAYIAELYVAEAERG